MQFKEHILLKVHSNLLHMIFQKGLDNIVDLSVKLVETKRHKVYDMVYELFKLVLLLPMATTSVERVFSAMVFVKTKLRNKMEIVF